MSEDSSSDEEWGLYTKRQAYNVNPHAKCWECGKKIKNLKSLILHYKSHKIKATCHICKVTFCRLTSLSTHLDNVHSPPFCKKCHQSFSNVWELNKHVETNCISSASFQEGSISAVINNRQNCVNVTNEVTVHRSLSPQDSVSELRSEQKIDMKPEALGNSVEYIVGEDDKDADVESDCSTSSESDDEEKKHSNCRDPESDSSSTVSSSDSSNPPPSKMSPKPNPNANVTMCSMCGRGPFRSLKLHLLHCSGIKIKYQCFMCKKIFQTEASLKEHHMHLYSCHICGQVFSNESLYHYHQCPKGTSPSFAFFCSESMPKACNICKSFFTSEKTLSDHINRVHMSVVSTKVCIITNPSVLMDKKFPSGLPSTEVQSTSSRPTIVNQAVNGKLHVGQAFTGIQPSSLPAPSLPSGKDAAQAQPADKPSSPEGTTPETSDPGSPETPTILAMFVNDSQDVALMKRMNTGWRSKGPYPCRQCGAILRQPSLIISHRYLHRGRRSHHCQCGRAFKHRLHLLRHCVQHAEAKSYICVSCGDTFTGAKLLAQHLMGKSQKKFHSGHTRKSKVKGKCRMPFTCDCGQFFFRPSAYIWHQLKNRTKKENS